MSWATVSNVLNRPTVARHPARDGDRRLGFVRNESARQLRAGQSRTIGLVVLDVANPFFTDVARGVEDGADAAGLAAILCNSDERAGEEAALPRRCSQQQRVQGVLITPVDRRHPAP